MTGNSLFYHSDHDKINGKSLFYHNDLGLDNMNGKSLFYHMIVTMSLTRWMANLYFTLLTRTWQQEWQLNILPNWPWLDKMNGKSLFYHTDLELCVRSSTPVYKPILKFLAWRCTYF